MSDLTYDPLFSSAIRRGNKDHFFALLPNANVHALGPSGETALHYAAVSNQADMAKRLLDRGADANAPALNKDTSLHWAASGDSLETAALLLNHGADPNAADQHGNGPLWTALFSGSALPALVQLLLDKGADPLHRNIYGGTPYEEAFTRGRTEARRLMQAYVKQS